MHPRGSSRKNGPGNELQCSTRHKDTISPNSFTTSPRFDVPFFQHHHGGPHFRELAKRLHQATPSRRGKWFELYFFLIFYFINIFWQGFLCFIFCTVPEICAPEAAAEIMDRATICSAARDTRITSVLIDCAADGDPTTGQFSTGTDVYIPVVTCRYLYEDRHDPPTTTTTTTTTSPSASFKKSVVFFCFFLRFMIFLDFY